jgi:hypothetical protein
MVLIDVVVPGKLGGRNQRNGQKTGSQQEQMEEFHTCPMLQKELQELNNNNNNNNNNIDYHINHLK